MFVVPAKAGTQFSFPNTTGILNSALGSRFRENDKQASRSDYSEHRPLVGHNLCYLALLHGNGVSDSLTVPLDISDRYLRRMACSNLPLRRDGAGMRSSRLIFPGSGICSVKRGATVGLSRPCWLSMFFMYMRACSRNGPHSSWAASSRICSERCQSSAEVRGM